MDKLEAYLFLFKDNFITSLMFIPKESYATDAMTMLGGYNLYVVLLVSLIASVLGLCCNWILGFFVRKFERVAYLQHRIDSLSSAEEFFNRKGKWILLFAFVPMWGALFTTAAGVMRYKFMHFCILVLFSKFIGLAIKIFF